MAMHSNAACAVSISVSIAASISLRRVSLAFSPERLLLDDVLGLTHSLAWSAAGWRLRALD
ncbi:hypothetical protein [Massilia sp. CCM 8734]|uniref:hypothetical protein n=1 Tax=Massilia sp. CCM 8734 TaxID=2609283 RepID=UPI00141E9A58|nr:hypothetical protein [Massilia sp. CCM 8734]NHZ97577.1 hypothetical protein [Massilia sp. CCM 8734]